MDSVNMFDPMTLSDAFQCALAFKKQNRRVGSSSSPDITGVSGLGNTVSRFAPNQAKAGHGNTRLVPKASGSSGLKCFNCGKLVHRQSECKKAGKRHLFADPEDNDNDVAYDDYEGPLIFNDEPEYEEEYVSGDMGVNLVVRRSCLTPKADGDDWLKHNIFQLTCTILGKVCTFVYDSGSCDNLIAEEAVHKLGLKTKNRPKPYKLQWLKKGREVTVSKRVHVPFSKRMDELRHNLVYWDTKAEADAFLETDVVSRDEILLNLCIVNKLKKNMMKKKSG
nr:putative reverse transcriptase domain-containing protein [Tanacetum cinerariifolium]